MGISMLLVGCSFSFSVGDSGLTTSELEQNLSAEVAEKVGDPLDEVDCSRGLDDTVGDQATCVVLLDGVRATWDVEVTEVADESIFFAWQVQEGSQRMLDEQLTDEFGPRFRGLTGLDLVKVSCPDGAVGPPIGTVVVCEATARSGRTGPIEVRFDGADGMVVDMTWRLAGTGAPGTT